MLYILQLFFFLILVFLMRFFSSRRTSENESKLLSLFIFLAFLLCFISFVILETYLFLLFVIYISVLIWVGKKNYYNLKIKDLEIKSNKLSRDYKIVFISDFHYDIKRNKFNDKAMKNLLDSLPTEGIDLLLLGGDYANYSENIDIFIKYMSQVTLKVPTIAIYGNHDFDKIDKFDELFQQINVRTLHNSHIIFNSDLIISGVEDLWTGSPDYKIYNKNIDLNKFNILLSHNPDYINKIFDEEFDLALSGHYHAGQVDLIPKFKFPSLISKYVYGNYAIKNKILYVTSGVGGTFFRGNFSAYARFGSNAEIVLINLKKKNK